MSAVGEQELKKAIAEGDWSHVYFIYGEEDYLKRHYVSLLQKKLVDPAFDTFNLHTFEGKDTDMQEIFSAAESLPMMADWMCLVVRDFPFDKLAAADVKRLDVWLQDVPESTVLIFWMDQTAVDVRRAPKWKKFVDLFAKRGTCAKLDRRTAASLSKLLTDGAKKRGCALDRKLADYMLTQAGSDLQTLLNELEKLCAYVGEGEIAREHIDLLVTKSLDAKVFDLSKTLVHRQYDRAYAILEELIAMKEEPVVILSVLSGAYVDMVRAKAAKVAGVSSAEAVRDFPQYKGKEFRLRNAMRDCDQMSQGQLRRSIEVLCDADRKLKGAPVEGRFVLEEAVAKLLLAAREA